MFKDIADPIKYMEEAKKELTITTMEELKSIPYQCCPICSGQGVIINVSFGSTTAPLMKVCPTCNGQRIIPQHLIK